MNRGLPGWKLVELDGRNAALCAAAARLLVAGFREYWPDAWSTLESAEAEVEEALAAEKVAFAAVSEADGTLIGWIGGQPHYSGNVWEVHPLVVRGESRRGGVGRALVQRLEDEVGARGGITLWVGTDDEAELTTVGGVDAYPDVLGKLVTIENLRGHPMAFYRSLGFELVGMVPDANGYGKPDLLMARRVGGEGVGPPPAAGAAP